MSTLSNVKNLKESLSKEIPPALNNNDPASVERCQDILKRLDECAIDLTVLSESLIGTVVSKLKHHAILGEPAKALVKKWKKVAKDTNEKNGSAEAASVPSPTAAKKKTVTPTKSATVTTKFKQERRDSSLSAAASDQESPGSAWAGLPEQRQNICKKLSSLLLLVKADLVKSGINGDAVEHLVEQRAAEIESATYQNFRDRKDYANKARSLAFNLKKNRDLCQEIILGHIEAEELVKMSSEQLASDETKKERQKQAQKLIDSKRLDWDQANEDKINQMCGIKGDLLKASLFTCSRCKSVKTTSTQKQTRSADEPMTVFVLCLNCGKRWKC